MNGLKMNREQLAAMRKRRIERTIDLFHMGLSDLEIANILGVSRESVCSYRGAAGLYRKGPYQNSRLKPGVPVDTRKIATNSAILIVRPAASTLKAKWRKCMKCGVKFYSEHAGDRACKPCKGSREWRSGGDFSVGGRI